MPTETETIKPKKAPYKRNNLNTKTGRYFIAQLSGKNKEESKEIANYSKNTKPATIENTATYQELVKLYLDPAEKQALKTFLDLSAETNDDKDNRLKASIETLKLKDRYPKDATKIIGIFNKIDSIKEDDINLNPNQTNATESNIEPQNQAEI
jgi:hypothetical protein